MRGFFLFSFIAFFASCTDANPGYQSDPSLPGECRRGEAINQTFDNFEQSDLLDILFVVDASGNSETLLNLTKEALPGFLERFENKEIHVKMGVATTQRKSKISSGENCAESIKIVDSVDDSNWKEIAACNTTQKLEADAADEPLSVALALQNSALWRKRAKRLVVIISRDDDCSGANISGDKPREKCNDAERMPLNVFEEGFLKDIKSEEGFTLAIIAGPSSGDVNRPVCNSSVGPVYAANRLNELADSLGERAIRQNLCGNNLGPPLKKIAEKIVASGTTLCAQKKMEHEPLRVVDGEDRILNLGKDGFIYEADQHSCENGAIVLDHSGSRALEEVKVTYCVL